MSASLEDPYALLGVAPTATAAELKSAWRARMREVHPDVGGDHDLSIEVHEAYEMLSDPARRTAFDEAAAERVQGEQRYEARRQAERERSAAQQRAAADRRRADQERRAEAPPRQGPDDRESSRSKGSSDRASEEPDEAQRREAEAESERRRRAEAAHRRAADELNERRRQSIEAEQRRLADEERNRIFSETYDRHGSQQTGSWRCSVCDANRLVRSDRCWVHSSEEQISASTGAAGRFCCSVTKKNTGCFNPAPPLCALHQKRPPGDAGAAARERARAARDASAFWETKGENRRPTATPPNSQNATQGGGGGAAEDPRPSHVDLVGTIVSNAPTDRRIPLVLLLLAGLLVAALVGVMGGPSAVWNRVAASLGLSHVDDVELRVGEPAAIGPERAECRGADDVPTEFGLDRAGSDWVFNAVLPRSDDTGQTLFMLIELNGKSRSIDLNGEDVALAAAVGSIAAIRAADLEAIRDSTLKTDVAGGVTLAATSKNNIDDSKIPVAASYDSATTSLSLSVSTEDVAEATKKGFDVRIRYYLWDGTALTDLQSCEG